MITNHNRFLDIPCTVIEHNPNSHQHFQRLQVKLGQQATDQLSLKPEKLQLGKDESLQESIVADTVVYQPQGDKSVWKCWVENCRELVSAVFDLQVLQLG